MIHSVPFTETSSVTFPVCPFTEEGGTPVSGPRSLPVCVCGGGGGTLPKGTRAGVHLDSN